MDMDYVWTWTVSADGNTVFMHQAVYRTEVNDRLVYGNGEDSVRALKQGQRRKAIEHYNETI